MTANYVLLERITVGEAGAASVTFNNIPQSGYTDLKVVWSGRNSSTNDYVAISFNGSSSSITQRTLFGTGSSASSFTTPVQYVGHLDNTNLTANTFTNSEIYIPNYTSSNYKSYSTDGAQENNGTGAQVNLTAGLWSNPAAITSVTLSPSGANFVQYSTFSLYALAAVGTTPVIAPYASGGDIITTDGTYWIHTFLSSGTFTPAKALSCDYLVVAGGAGGGSGGGGGAGGAGGARSTVTWTGGNSIGTNLESALALTSNTSYAVTIGAGGSVDTNGSNSVFSTITSIGGGKGGSGSGSGTAGSSGGSGGGGTGNPNGLSGGAGTNNQGYAGGAGNGAGSNPGGGGGGAGSAGGNGNPSPIIGGAGGSGIYTAITDAFGTLTGIGQLSSGHYYFAGGGGGGTYNTSFTPTAGAGGLGGGGAGSISGNATAGTPNLGAGGGSAANNGTSGKGGSGIVIVRYLM